MQAMFQFLIEAFKLFQCTASLYPNEYLPILLLILGTFTVFESIPQLMTCSAQIHITTCLIIYDIELLLGRRLTRVITF